MSFSKIVPHSPSSWRALFLKSVREFIPRPAAEQEPDTILEDLERLAMLSPHLLVDLGFSIDKSESTASAVCWCLDDMLVFVSVAEGRSFAMRDPARTRDKLDHFRDWSVSPAWKAKDDLSPRKPEASALGP